MSIDFGANCPSLTVEAYLDGAWRDISVYARLLDTDRGRDAEQDRYAGTATLVLTNTDGRFSSDNTSGPYSSGGVSWLDQYAPVRVRATWSSTTYALFFGLADDWNEALLYSGRDSVVTVPLYDPLSTLAGIDGQIGASAVGDGEQLTARISRLLTEWGWTFGSTVVGGSTPFQATDLSANAMTELLLTVDSEGGAVYCAGDGSLVVHDRAALATLTRCNTSQVTFGNAYASGEVPFDEPVLPNGGSGAVVNEARFARVGGVEQVVTDSASVSKYRLRRRTRTGLICQSDAEVAGLAALTVALRKDAEKRIDGLTVHPMAYPTVSWPHLLGRELRDRAVVKVSGTVTGVTIERHVFIERVAHHIDVLNRTWSTDFRFSSATAWDSLAADVWDTGEWDAATWFF